MSKITHKNFPELLEPYFRKAPELSKNTKKFIIQFVPYYALFIGILGILGAISTLGILSAASPFNMSSTAKTAVIGMNTLSSLFWLASSVLKIMAYPDLDNHKYKGWNLLFWSTIVHFMGSVFAGEFLIPLLFGIIGLYILFQIKPHYK